VEEESIRDNFVVIYELLDEMADFGYPQTTEPSLLKEYIMNESQKLSRGAAAKVGGGLTNALTGGWFNATNRVTKSYNRNEVWIGTATTQWPSLASSIFDPHPLLLFLDVVEKVNLMVSAKGSVLQHDVQGQVKMKAQMNGIPVVHLGFNNKFNFTRATEGSNY
jgi:AP-1 complex subunit mu